MSTDVIFGASGYAGGNILTELRSRGHEVVAVSRKIKGFEDEGDVTVRQGTVFDAGFVADVARGADTIVVALPAITDDTPPLADAVPSLVEAAAANGARLGVVGATSGFRITDDGPTVLDDPNFPDEYKPGAEAHEALFQALQEHGGQIDWFYLSPANEFGSYNPGERQGTYRTSDDVLVTGDDGRSYISGADYGLAFADEIEHPAHHRTRFTVGY